MLPTWLRRDYSPPGTGNPIPSVGNGALLGVLVSAVGVGGVDLALLTGGHGPLRPWPHMLSQTSETGWGKFVNVVHNLLLTELFDFVLDQGFNLRCWQPQLPPSFSLLMPRCDRSSREKQVWHNLALTSTFWGTLLIAFLLLVSTGY